MENKQISPDIILGKRILNLSLLIITGIVTYIIITFVILMLMSSQGTRIGALILGIYEVLLLLCIGYCFYLLNRCRLDLKTGSKKQVLAEVIQVRRRSLMLKYNDDTKMYYLPKQITKLAKIEQRDMINVTFMERSRIIIDVVK